MTTLSAIVILEDGLEVNSSDSNGFFVFTDYLSEIVLISVSTL